MSYPKIIKEAALEKMFHTDLSLRYISDVWKTRIKGLNRRGAEAQRKLSIC